jgi:hypothetical protein
LIDLPSISKAQPRNPTVLTAAAILLAAKLCCQLAKIEVRADDEGHELKQIRSMTQHDVTFRLKAKRFQS